MPSEFTPIIQTNVNVTSIAYGIALRWKQRTYLQHLAKCQASFCIMLNTPRREAL